MNGRFDEILWGLLEGSPEEWAIFAVGFILIVGLVWFVFHMSARLREDDGPAVSDQYLLTQFRELRREGDLSEEEYRSIKGSLVQSITDKADEVKPAD